jgi:putative ABC transport system ATP-binding protein
LSLLELRDVVKRYASGDTVVRALDRANLAVDSGELVAIYGPSGSGKSTLLLIAAGMLAPDRGSVRYADRDIANLTDAESADLIRREIGFVFQSFFLLPGVTAIDNVALPLLAERISMREARRRAAPLLERVGLGHRMTHRPMQLSGGERQRVAVARALVNRPRLILADEPTGSLDTKSGTAVLELLSEICGEHRAAAIVVTHDPVAASIAARVHDLRDGRLSAPGAGGLRAPATTSEV